MYFARQCDTCFYFSAQNMSLRLKTTMDGFKDRNIYKLKRENDENLCFSFSFLAYIWLLFKST